MKTDKEAIQNRKDIQAYRDRQRQMMHELWVRSTRLADLTDNLEAIQADAKDPARMQAVLRLLDCVIADLEQQEAEEIARNEQEMPEF